MENNDTPTAIEYSPFDFSYLIEEYSENYIFQSDEQRQEFVNNLKETAKCDEYLWDMIRQQISDIATDFAERMELQCCE